MTSSSSPATTSTVGAQHGLVWCGPVFDPTGYADEARGMLCALEAAGAPVTLRPANRQAPGFRESLPADERRTLDRQIARALPVHQILVQHHTADGFFRVEGNAYRIGRTMFETDSIPPSWIRHCNQMDELWLPSQFNIDTFRRAGVHVPMVRVPGGIDSGFFHPGVAPMVVPGLRGTVYLAVFEWRLRKGWDLLLRAWADAFSANDDVTLVLRTYPIDKASGQDNETVINARIDAFLEEQCGRSRSDVAPIIVLGKTVPGSDMPSLYRIAHVLVAPTRGEGWGRPFMEAMASGVPVIATRWSAHLEFMNDDNSLLLDISGTEQADGVEVPLYRDQQWAAPRVPHLCELLQRVHAQPDATRALGERARHDMVTLWPWSRAAEVIRARLAEIGELRNRVGAGERQPTACSSLPKALTNQRLLVNARLFDAAQGESTADRVIGHLIAHWPHRVRVHTRVTAPLRPTALSPAMHAYRAAMCDESPSTPNDLVLTWLDGTCSLPLNRPACTWWTVHTGDRVASEVPAELVRVLRDCTDDVWVPTTQAHSACMRAGIAAERLWLMPPERAPEHITADGPRQPLRLRADTVFLLPAIDVAQSESIDLILKTWQRAFDSTQSALLIVYAPEGSDPVVKAWHQQIIAKLSSGRLLLGAPIQIFREHLGFDELASLVRACDVVLDPFPMASTMPVVQAAMATRRAVLGGCGGSADTTIGVLNTTTAWREALRAATNADERALSISNALCSDGEMVSAASIGAAASQRLALGCKRDNHRHLALVAHGAEPFAIHDVRATTILAHLDWHDGTGSGVLQSFMRSLSSSDDVSLVLCLDPAQGFAVEQVAQLVKDAMQTAGKTEASMPDIVLIPDVLTDEIRRSLLARCDAVVAVNDVIIAQAASASGRRIVANLSPNAWRSAVGVPLGTA